MIMWQKSLHIIFLTLILNIFYVLGRKFEFTYLEVLNSSKSILSYQNNISLIVSIILSIKD